MNLEGCHLFDVLFTTEVLTLPVPTFIAEVTNQRAVYGK